MKSGVIPGGGAKAGVLASMKAYDEFILYFQPTVETLGVMREYIPLQ